MVIIRDFFCEKLLNSSVHIWVGIWVTAWVSVLNDSSMTKLTHLTLMIASILSYLAKNWIPLKNSCMTSLIICISFILLNAPSRKQSTIWYQSKTLPPNLNRIQKWRMACLFLRSSTTGCTASQLQLFHHNLLCSTKDHRGALHPSSSWGDRSQACFCGSPSLLECLPPLSLQPLSCRQEDGCSAWAKSSKAGRKNSASPKREAGNECPV